MLACQVAMDWGDFTREFSYLCANASGNNATSNVTSELWVLPDKTSGLVTAIFLLLILAVGLPWNLLVTVIILKERLYKQPTIILLLNLVITDLLLLLVLLPPDIITGITGEFVVGFSDHMRCNICKSAVITVTCFLVSFFTITAMSFDRFMFIYKPLKYDRIITSFKMLLALSLIWVVCALVSILPLVGFGEIVFFPPLLACLYNIPDEDKYPTLLFSVCCLAILVTVVFNLWVVFIVQKNIRAIYKVRKSLVDTVEGGKALYKRMKKKREEKQLHLIKVFGGLLFCNLITWLPITCVSLYLFFTKGQNGPPTPVFTVVDILCLSQLVLHPILETGLIRDVKEPMKKIILCLFRKKDIVSSKNNETNSTEKEKRCGQDTDKKDAEAETCCACGFFAILGAALLPEDSYNTNTTENS